MKRILPAIVVLRLIAGSVHAQTPQPRATYTDATHDTVLLEMNGKQYLVDVAAHSVRDAGSSPPSPQSEATAPQSSAADLFRQDCAECHGADGKGVRERGTPDFTSRSMQDTLSDRDIINIIRKGKDGMPAWSAKLSDAQISELAAYIRSFAGTSSSTSSPSAPSGVYQPGDDVLVSLPTGRPVDRNAVIVNFSHRFPYDSAVSGPARGAELFGLDNFALPSFGLRYGVTDKLSVDVWRSPSFIDRPIQLMAAYNLLDENHAAPFNLTVRASIEGQDNFRKNYTENLEAIFSRSLTSHAQFYVVPTMSFNDRELLMGSLVSSQIQDVPGINAFSTGFGFAVDIRPTVALLFEAIPTLVNGEELGIHRPAFSFGIQKKIYRHAFTLALTNSPGTTVSQRAGTDATFLGEPSADTFSHLFIAFNITRQIH
jgi:mono/diheme cytochrome c family protein